MASRVFGILENSVPCRMAAPWNCENPRLLYNSVTLDFGQAFHNLKPIQALSASEWSQHVLHSLTLRSCVGTFCPRKPDLQIPL